MEEPSLVTPDMEQNEDIQPGFFSSGQKLEQPQETHSDNFSLIQKLPLTQDTGDLQDSAPRERPETETGLRRRIPHQFENNLDATKKDLQRPPPEISDEGGLVSDKNTKTEKTCAQDEKSFIPQSTKVNINNENGHSENGQFHGDHNTEKTDTKDGQKSTIRNHSDSVDENVTFFPKEGVPVNLDGKIPASPALNSSTSEDSPNTVKNMIKGKDHKTKQDRKDVFPGKKIAVIVICALVLSITSWYMYISSVSGGPPLKDVQSVDLEGHQYISNISVDHPVKYVQIGDLIAIRRLWGLYYHYMVYLGNETVVHNTGDIYDWLFFVKGRVKMEKLVNVIAQGDYVRIENGTWKGKEPPPKQDIIARAMFKIGQRGFNLLLNNCEHFAHWCRYGETFSHQADNLSLYLKYIFVLFVCLMVLICLVYRNRKSFPN